MTDASFSAAGYAIMIEDDPQQKYTSTRKTYAPVAFGSKRFNPTQLKMSIYAKEFLAIFFAFSDFGYILWEADKPTIILTDNQAVTRFFHTKLIPPPLWNACDFVLQFRFTIAHIAGKTNTAADFLSRLEHFPAEKLQLKIRDDIKITPVEVNIQNLGTTDEEQIFFEPDQNITEEQLWTRKYKARNLPDQIPAQITLNSLEPVINTEHTNASFNVERNCKICLEQAKDTYLHILKQKLSCEQYDINILIQESALYLLRKDSLSSDLFQRLRGDVTGGRYLDQFNLMPET